MIEYIKELLSKWYIYLGFLFFVDDVISFIFNTNISLPDKFKYIILILIVLYATYKVWENERNEKVRLDLIVNGKMPNLSAEAEELLKDATKSPKGVITELNYLSGFSIQIDKKYYTLNKPPRVVAKYKSALEELIKNDLIDEKKVDFYEIKEKGYKYLEEKNI